VNLKNKKILHLATVSVVVYPPVCLGTAPVDCQYTVPHPILLHVVVWRFCQRLRSILRPIWKTLSMLPRGKRPCPRVSWVIDLQTPDHHPRSRSWRLEFSAFRCGGDWGSRSKSQRFGMWHFEKSQDKPSGEGLPNEVAYQPQANRALQSTGSRKAERTEVQVFPIVSSTIDYPAAHSIIRYSDATFPPFYTSLLK
jgi:hypothetical protein